MPFWGAREKALPKEGLLCGQGQALLSSLQLCAVATMFALNRLDHRSDMSFQRGWVTF
ncbi:protein of unknown function (plasmid) [Xenorhabdus nematophila AN6/1]|nr:protein of unknown function [Xenorhabdus nematophila AN6/1]